MGCIVNDWMEQLRFCGEGKCDHADRKGCVEAIFASQPVLIHSTEKKTFGELLLCRVEQDADFAKVVSFVPAAAFARDTDQRH